MRYVCLQPGSFDAEEEKFYAVELHRGSRGFGFSIRGGQEFNSMPLYVLRIADGGAADLDGRLRVGAAETQSSGGRRIMIATKCTINEGGE